MDRYENICLICYGMVCLGDMVPKMAKPGRPKTTTGTFAAKVRESNPNAKKDDIDKLRKIKLDEEK